MTYKVGTKIDLSELNDAPTVRRSVARDDYDLFETGTKISFLRMACGMVVMNITEPPIALRVALRA